ncbi:hypothetical protein ABTN73_20195, partial [Acinetobacter baumannii]
MEGSIHSVNVSPAKPDIEWLSPKRQSAQSFHPISGQSIGTCTQNIALLLEGDENRLGQDYGQ